MNNIAKGMLLVLVILYILSPLDACPGPIDDVIVFAVGCAAAKNQRVQEE